MWTGTDPLNPRTATEYGYDTLGRLETVTQTHREGAALPDPEITAYHYDPVGNIDYTTLPNGVITDYVYNDINRLDFMAHYAPEDGTGDPVDYRDNEVIASYDYQLRPDGLRTGVIETDDQGRVTNISWSYDNLGRLIQESHDSFDDGLDFVSRYEYDLIGNRTGKFTDNDADTEWDEVVAYTYDNNDRLLTEIKTREGIDAVRTDYEYGSFVDGTYTATQQTGKTVTDIQTGEVTEETQYGYNLQGRMSDVDIDSYSGGVLTRRVSEEYVYDNAGMRVRATETVDADGDGTVDSTKVTEYLNDPRNHTGYAQALEERVVQDSVESIKTYTIGHDVIAQTSAADAYFLLADGHGSTRALVDALAQVMQRYSYDAYGNTLGFDPVNALTSLLYSGETFDAATGLHYLRARFYDPATGRFNRLDPFSGFISDPASLHKYAYCIGDPINGIDPSGRFTLIETLKTSAILGVISGTVNVVISGMISPHKSWEDVAKKFIIGYGSGALFGLFAGGGIWLGMGGTFLSGMGHNAATQLWLEDGPFDAIEALLSGLASAGIFGGVAGIMRTLSPTIANAINNALSGSGGGGVPAVVLAGIQRTMSGSVSTNAAAAVNAASEAAAQTTGALIPNIVTQLSRSQSGAGGSSQGRGGGEGNCTSNKQIDPDIEQKIGQFKKKSLRDQKSIYKNLQKTYEKHLLKYGQKPGQTTGETNRIERELREMQRILQQRGQDL